MSLTTQLDTFVTRLTEAGCGKGEPSGGEPDYREAYAIFSELLDVIEAFNGAAEYQHFLTQMVPIFLSNLKRVPVSFNLGLPEHRLRNIILEIIHRLIMNETFAPFAGDILDCLQLIIVEENEENGVLCMKIITLLHKAFRDKLNAKIKPFFEIICQIYDHVNDTMKEAFAQPETKPLPPEDVEDMDTLDTPKTHLNRAMYSFKTLAECPITMVLLYLSYKELLLIQLLLPIFLPKVVNLLQVEADAQREWRLKSPDGVVTLISPEITNHQAYLDLVLAQVKAALFLAYVFIRDYIKHMQNLQWKQQLATTVPDVILRLLQDCPAELLVARKELLHATKHILLTSFRTNFIAKIDLLFNENILIGEGLTLHETLRPLAYSIVADFIHNVRDELLPKQIWLTVEIYCGLLKDDSLALTVQIMLAKLLLNLVEKIMVLPNKVEGRQLFMIIIDAYAKRFENLARKYPYIIAQHREYERKSKLRQEELKKAIERYNSLKAKDPLEEEAAKDLAKQEEEENKNDTDEVEKYVSLFNIDLYSPIGYHVLTLAGILGALALLDLLKDVHYFYRNLMRFLKLVIFGLKHCNPVPPEGGVAQAKDMAKLISFEETNIFRNLFRGGISCLQFFAVQRPQHRQPKDFDFSTGGPNLPITLLKEEKDLMEIFATIFIHIDPALFNEIVNHELDFLYELMLNNVALLHLPQFFLALEVTLANFMLIVIKFLRDHLADLGEGDVVKLNILIRLFKLCFMLVNLFPATNEAVLLPHLTELILGLLKLATLADEPIIYMFLIRILFRLILGGRFEQFYKEIMPILPVLLELLNKLIANLRRQYERDMYVELCLTVPVRLLVLVPHLRYLTRPLVYALNGGPELVNQGLRTFELCVDNFTAEYFDPMIEPVIDEIMAALWKHLEPVPYHHQHSHTAIRILGKLGGRNHKHFKQVLNLAAMDAMLQEVMATFKVAGIPKEVPMLITPGVKLALKLFEDPRVKLHYRLSAYRYLVAILQLFIDTTPIPEDYGAQVPQWVDKLGEPAPEEAKQYPALPPTDCKDPTKLDLQQQLFAKLLEVVFSLLLVPELVEELTALIEGLTDHFCLLHVHTAIIDKIKKERPFSVQDQEGKATISEQAYLDAITYALSHWNKTVRDAGMKAIRQVWDTLVVLFKLPQAALLFPLFRTMFYRFTHCCYNEYYLNKLGGVLGLQEMFELLDIPAEWFFPRQFELVRLVFFVLRDTPETAPAEVCEVAEKLVLKVLHECNKSLLELAVLDKPFQTIVGALVYDLALSNERVRRVAQQGLREIQDATGVEMAKFIEPCKHVLMTPIFRKPLRALPFPMQIGNIDAITFCLELPNTFLQFGDELNRLLLEALALVDAEDELLANVHRLYEYRTAHQLIELRVVCIRLLLLALTKPDFTLGSLPEARIRILGVFFKALCNKSTEIINAAHKGLKALLQENARLPKELLQKGLRPMLMNLSDHKKLTVLGLEALARLLELLISYFRVEIGRKLLDHLMAWAQINTLRLIAGQDLENNETVKIVMAILNIFHLLPARAFTFMVEIINTLQYLEGHLDRHQYLPFRKPVAKFLNRFAENTMEYYTTHFSNRKLGNMLAQITGMPECDNIRVHAKEKLGDLMTELELELNDEVKAVKYANFVDLLIAIVPHDAEWFSLQRPMLVKLLKMVPEMRKIKQEAALVLSVHFQLDQAVTKLLEIVVQFMTAQKGDFELLVTVVDSGMLVQGKVPPLLEDYVWNEIVALSDADQQKKYLSEVVKYVASVDPEQEVLSTKVFLFRYVFNAILLRHGALEDNLDAVTGDWIEAVHKTIWLSNRDIINDHSSGKLDQYRYVLLETTAILLKWCPDKLELMRKDVIKFSWNYLRLEDQITKQVAYVTTALFISHFDTPIKLVTQVFVALLKTHHTEVRQLVRQALDILAPVMTKRTDDDQLWLRWPRRVLLEDGFNVTNVLNVYQFIVHHPDLFFPAREHFIGNMITAMGKLTIQVNPVIENQVLAIELLELILKWENKAKEEQAMEVDGDFVTSQGYTIPLGQREACVTFLVRYVCILPQRALELELGQKALGILHDLLSPAHWPLVQVKLTFFEKFLLLNDLNAANFLGYCLNALEVLGVVLEWKLAQWIVTNLAYLHKLLEKCIKLDNTDIQDVLQRVLRIILLAINEVNGSSGEENGGAEEDDDTKEFINLLHSTVAEDLGEMTLTAAGVTLLWTLANYRPAVLDDLMPLVMKTFSKLCKDHITITHQGNAPLGSGSRNGTSSSGGNATNGLLGPLAEYEAQMTTKLLEKMLYLLAMRISTLGDQRRTFLVLLGQLIERLLDKDTLEKIIRIVKGWVFDRTDLFPTTKEKAVILGKMMVFEVRGEPALLKEFYQIIIDIFEDDAFSCTELTVRMEQPFLVGTRLADVEIRRKLMSILNHLLESDIAKRLYYIVRQQNWEYLADYPWLNQAIQLLFGLFDLDSPVKLHQAHQTAPLTLFPYKGSGEDDEERMEVENTDEMTALFAKHNKWLANVDLLEAHQLIDPLIDTFYQLPECVYSAWAQVFPLAFSAVPRGEHLDFTRALVVLLLKDYHTRQIDMRPNVIQMLLEGVRRCEGLELPPFAVECLGANFDAWTQAMAMLEATQDANHSLADVREVTMDALAKLYASLREDDMLYGLWRRRAKYQETILALLYEQIGMWDRALRLYENAQVKARSGALPYLESEYALWEDHWIYCAEKLQHWDILTDLARHEGFSDLLLECGWRVADWNNDRDTLEQTVKNVMDVPTPRRQVFETFLCLQGFAQEKYTIAELTRYCDEGIQLALRKWHGLPARFHAAHIPLLHTFQQYVEFMEALQVYTLLLTTNAQNLDVKSQELKRVLQVWRERLPNTWDDINMWNDLVTWRQHAFQVINKVYMPFIPMLQQLNSLGTANLYAYRGFHEIAWVINRFAHVARKHHMPDVCIKELSRIYQLPNIEIHEAFLKLKEQVKCHYHNPAELNTGLDVISNTNLVFFTTQQKAEFFTLKGMFLNKMNQKDEANKAFATSVQIDLNLPKAWAEWGTFNDKRFKENQNDMVYANNAISCYLQAAGLYKNGKTRKLLARILWLISLDDELGTLARAFDDFKGEVPVWYWITFIPQLLTALGYKEAKLTRQVLMRIAKLYPQALHFQLRTTKEDLTAQQRQIADKKRDEAPAQQLASTLEHVDEIMGILKTAYPLLALLLELIVDQINQRFKCTADEDAYRLGVALLNDGIQFLNRSGNPWDDTKLPPVTEANITRFAETVLPKQIRAEFKKDLVANKPNLETYIIKLRHWRDRFEDKLDRRLRQVLLENLCPHLVEFHHQKFEEIEVPGQYLLNKDNNNHFVKIERFLPTVDLARGTTACYKRLRIRGHDGTLHTFAVQFPAARHCRREELIFQLFRIFGDALNALVETRRRNISFSMPVAVPLLPHIRIIKDDERNITMQKIYEDWCRANGKLRDEPFVYTIDKLRAAYDQRLPKPDMMLIRVEILGAIQLLLVPLTVLKDYFVNLYPQFEDFWLFRKQFTAQYALFIFTTYMMFINARQPQKIHVNQSLGTVWTLDMLPCKMALKQVLQQREQAAAAASAQRQGNNEVLTTDSEPKPVPIFCNAELVPFRLTPNIQKLIGETLLEGVLAVYVLCIARALAEPDLDLENYVTLFVRDEVISWWNQTLNQDAKQEPMPLGKQFRNLVKVNVDYILKRVFLMVHVQPGATVATQNVLELISQAVNPRNLAAADTLWMAYF